MTNCRERHPPTKTEGQKARGTYILGGYVQVVEKAVVVHVLRNGTRHRASGKSTKGEKHERETEREPEIERA